MEKSSENARLRIVILGTGFGGIHTYSYLRKILGPKEAEITLVDRNNYFLFTPMLHEVATGGLNPSHIVEPSRKITRRHPDDVWVAEIKSIDLEKKTIKTSSGNIAYDYLVIATGATTNFFGVPGAQKYSCVLKSLDNAVRMKNNFIDIFERASKIKDDAERQSLLSFAVVGGGATGVEVVTEMAELFYKTFESYYKKIYCVHEVKLHLLNRGSELLQQFHPELRSRALKILKAKGVNVHLNSGVTEVKKDGVVLSDGGFLPTQNVIWLAGVRPNTPQFKQDVALERERIVVDDFLRLKGHENIFAIGDVAHFSQGEGRPLPMLAQVATREAKAVAKNIRASIKGRSLREFRYRSKGELISLGQWRALGNVLNIRMSGPHIWWLWRTVYLSKFNSWTKRIKIAIDWTVNAFSPRDIAKTD